MANSFPRQGDSTHAQEIPEEDVDGDGQFLKIITIDIDADEKTDESSSGSEQSPVPLPSATNRIESRVARSVYLSMLGQNSQVENQSDSKSDCKANAYITAGLDVFDCSVALGSIGPRAVRKDISWSVRIES